MVFNECDVENRLLDTCVHDRTLPSRFLRLVATPSSQNAQNGLFRTYRPVRALRTVNMPVIVITTLVLVLT